MRGHSGQARRGGTGWSRVGWGVLQECHAWASGLLVTPGPSYRAPAGSQEWAAGRIASRPRAGAAGAAVAGRRWGRHGNDGGANLLMSPPRLRITILERFVGRAAELLEGGGAETRYWAGGGGGGRQPTVQPAPGPLPPPRPSPTVLQPHSPAGLFPALLLAGLPPVLQRERAPLHTPAPVPASSGSEGSVCAP